MVTVDQTGHRFLFGCGAFDAVAIMKTQDEKKRAFLRERMEKWMRLFNYGTLPFYWGRYEPTEGQTAFAETMAAAKWLRGKGVQVKGHPLCWHTACAPWLMQYSNEEILRRQLARIHRDVTAYKGVIDLWDVINEVVIMPVFDKYDNAVTRICKDLGITCRSPHKGRKTYISTLLNKGIDPDFVRTQVGHRDLMTTLNSFAFSTTRKEEQLEVLR